MSFNTFIIHLSLKHLKNNYRLVVKLSKWINEELINICYSSDNKFIRASFQNDLEVIKLLIYLVQDKNMLTEYLLANEYDIDTLKLFMENGADVHANNEEE